MDKSFDLAYKWLEKHGERVYSEKGISYTTDSVIKALRIASSGKLIQPYEPYISDDNGGFYELPDDVFCSVCRQNMRTKVMFHSCGQVRTVMINQDRTTQDVKPEIECPYEHLRAQHEVEEGTKEKYLDDLRWQENQ